MSGLDTAAASGWALGAMFFGSTIDRERSFALLDRYVAAGGRIIDTANNYVVWIDGGTGDESETLVGEWLAARGARDDVLVATKLGARPSPGTQGSAAPMGLSAPAVAEQVAGSLARLGTDRLDLLYAHIDDPATPVAETAGAFERLVADGVTAAVGVSNWSAARAREASGLGALQMRATYLTAAAGTDFGRQLPVDGGHLALAAERGLVVFGYSALLGGGYTPGRALEERYDHAGTAAQLTVVRDVAAAAGATPNQVVLAWLVASGVTPVLGASRVEQLDEALAARDLVLDADALSRLDEARGGPLGVG